MAITGKSHLTKAYFDVLDTPWYIEWYMLLVYAIVLLVISIDIFIIYFFLQKRTRERQERERVERERVERERQERERDERERDERQERERQERERDERERQERERREKETREREKREREERERQERKAKEEIKDPIIANLIDDDIADIKGIGSQHQVQVNVMAAINQIQVLGEKSNVALAVKDITIIITDIKKAESELKSYQWQTKRKDSEIKSYSDANGFKLERAYMKKLSALEMIIDGIELVIDLDKMEERSKETGDVRKVARVPKNPNSGLFLPIAVKQPDTWEPQPQEAGGKLETMHMFEVASGSAEYQEALKRFHETIGSTTVQVVKLERIQNPNEYRKHSTLFEAISQKHHNKKIEVKQLFHGCKEDSVKPIATQGFNRNFAADANGIFYTLLQLFRSSACCKCILICQVANSLFYQIHDIVHISYTAAYYGQGVYFALNSSYSAQTNFSKLNKDGHQFMFISRVIIGEYTVGNNTMKVAPPLQEGSLELFDTLVERKDNPTIFVAMTDAQAYPEYLITFKGKS